MRNEFGLLLDRNGYAPSILRTAQGKCYICGRRAETERHEPFGAALRSKSKALGLWVNLCRECHRTGEQSVHKCKLAADVLREECQRAAMQQYGWSMGEWLARFYKNYIEEE